MKMNPNRDHGLRLASQHAGMSAVVSAMEAAAARSLASPTKSVKPSQTKSDRVKPSQSSSGVGGESRGRGKYGDGQPSSQRFAAPGDACPTVRSGPSLSDQSGSTKRIKTKKKRIFLEEVLWWWSIYPT